MLNDKVFVFVPSYNHARFIGRCLQSIIKQTVAPTKLLVIDDGSRDNSPEIIEKVLKNCPFPAELIARENRGLCRTLNEGFERSAGEYFAYLGSDDVWLPEFLARRTALMRQNSDAVMAFGNAYLIDENDAVIENSADWAAYKINDTRKMLLLGIAPVSSTVFYRRAALATVRWNEDSRLEDYELYLKLSALGEFAFDKAVYSTWRQHGYNTSRDVLLMLAEVLGALRRNAFVLRLNARELALVERRVNFRYAEDIARRGLKSKAFELWLANLRGAPDLQAVARVALRLLLPQSIVERRRKFVQQKMTGKLGAIEI